MGSKSRISKDIVPILNNLIKQYKIEMYIEPFVGGANIIDKISCSVKRGYDINPYLISLLDHMKYGGSLPEDITKEEYNNVRKYYNDNCKHGLYEDWYVGCVGFLASYNGRFFDGGYSGTTTAKNGTNRNYYNEAKSNIIKQTPNLIDIIFDCKDYLEHDFMNCFIYCDPPYGGVKQYNKQKLNCDEFWNMVRKWSRNNIVLISEHNAPEDFRCIWGQEVIRTIDNTKRIKSVEKLFTLNNIHHVI